MAIGRVLTSLLIRGIVFLLVSAAMASSARNPAAQRPRKTPSHLASMTRASIGFVASLAVTITMMIALSAPASLLEAPRWPLRGSIASE